MEKIDLGNIILIGSRATPNIFMRKTLDNSDFDIIMSGNQVEKLKNIVGANRLKSSRKYEGKYKFLDDDGNRFEIDATDSQSNSILLDLCTDIDICVGRSTVPTFANVKAATATTNYAIKRSHAHRNVHWMKTMNDLSILQNYVQQTVMQFKLDNFFKARQNEADERYNNIDKKISLAKSNDEFFKPAEHLRQYVHDDLHVAVAFNSRPMFERCKDDLERAEIKKRLWDKLSPLDKTKMAVEEISVLALERFYIPDVRKADRKTYFMLAYRDLTTKMCKGWFRDFLIDDYRRICLVGDRDYVSMFNEALNQGKIRKVGRENE